MTARLVEKLKNGVPVKVDRWPGKDGEDHIPIIGEASDTMREAAILIESLLDVLGRIAAHTDPEDPESYRSDDREGCLDTVNTISTSAIRGASS